MRWLKKLNCAPQDDLLPRLIQGDSIPKIIHQTFPTKDLPPKLRANVEFIRHQNPDYEWHFYDDETIVDFIGRHYGRRVLDLYLKVNPLYGAARADLFRYLCIYQVGGVYLDIKSTTTKPLSSVLQEKDRYILAQWGEEEDGGRFAGWGAYKALAQVEGGEFQQWHVIAVPGHPFLRAVINQVLTNIERYNPFMHGSGRPAVIHTTGPVAYTLAISAIRAQHSYRQVDIVKDLGIQYSIFARDADFSHHRLFKSHYSQRMDSVVQVGKLWEAIYLSVNRTHWKLRAGLREYRVARMLKNLILEK